MRVIRRATFVYAAATALLLAGCIKAPPTAEEALSYHFIAPAQNWEETLPLGNGRLGMMPDGGVARETVVLNEISLWSGSRQDADNPYARRSLDSIRLLLFQGRNDKAQSLMYQTFVCKGAGSGQGNGANLPYGSYQTLGNLLLTYTYRHSETDTICRYRRGLDLNTAIASVVYQKGAVRYTREAFASFAGDVGVLRLSADRDNALTFTVGMNRPERYEVFTSGKDLLMRGQLNNGTDGKGMRYAARVRILLPQGGTLLPSDSTLSVQNATEAVLLVSMATDYFGQEPEAQAVSLLDAAAKKDYATLRQEHIDAYRERFARVELDLGVNERQKWPIDQRLQAFQQDRDDPSLATLYFQFGRYLLISSTRPGLLPPNLQGLWANTIQTPWNGDYHLNINLQMNLWPAEVANLSELHLPLVEWTKQQVASGEQTAKIYYGARGWVTHILGNPWQFTAPGEHPSWGATNTSAAWLCRHLYEHYLYTLDNNYLREVYPVMKGAALFFTDMLTENYLTHYLVTSPTTSPENTFILPNGQQASVCAGSTMDNQILRELFANTIAAAHILGTDADFAEVLAAKRASLQPTTIGHDGRIMEWLEPYEEAEPHHRHLSHLYGLYPGNEISVRQTPELAAAARRSLIARGDQSTGWSMAWKINLWARLGDGQHAWQLLCHLLQPAGNDNGGTFPNLFCAHPPFQIDGNFGATAAIAEMLLQSQTETIQWLPALPAVWKNGRFKGLKVRGGGIVSAQWKDGQLTHASLKASVPYTYRLELPPHSANLSIRLNNHPLSCPVIHGAITLDLKANDEVLLTF